MLCEDCSNKDVCRRPCDGVERYLNKDNHSLKSNYKVVFVDPQFFEMDSNYETNYENTQKKNVLNEGDFTPMHSSTLKRPLKYRKKKEETKNELILEKLDKFLNQLPSRTRNCISMFYGVQGKYSLSQSKTAKVLHISQPTVGWHIRKAKSILYKKLDKYL